MILLENERNRTADRISQPENALRHPIVHTDSSSRVLALYQRHPPYIEHFFHNTTFFDTTSLAFVLLHVLQSSPTPASPSSPLAFRVSSLLTLLLAPLRLLRIPFTSFRAILALSSTLAPLHPPPPRSQLPTLSTSFSPSNPASHFALTSCLQFHKFTPMGRSQRICSPSHLARPSHSIADDDFPL